MWSFPLQMQGLPCQRLSSSEFKGRVTKNRKKVSCSAKLSLKIDPPLTSLVFFFFCTQICWHSSLVNSSQQTMWSIASDIKQLFLVSHMGIGHWTIKDGWILPVIRLTWEGFDGKSKQSRSLGAEQPTQVQVYQLPKGVDVLASLA